MTRKVTPDIEQKIIALYTTPAEDGTWTGCQSIAKLFSISAPYVGDILKRNGVSIRSSKEAHANGKVCKPVTNVPPSGQSAPLCKCGCGNPVIWNRRTNSWNLYVQGIGHYRKQAPYKSETWLREQYLTLHRSADDIAKECEICHSGIFRYLRKFNIPRRTQAQSLSLSGAVRGDKNPAWKGGCAKWDYSHDWKSLARSIRMRDKYICQSCGLTKKRWGVGLHVHHIDHDKTNNSPDNLISLCAQCHREVHAGKRDI